MTAKLPDHLFVSDIDGALYDTRIPGWHMLAPLRRNYRRTHERIATMQDLKATLRAGGYVWPGGYPLYFICGDGGIMSWESVSSNLEYVFDAVMHEPENSHWSGWRVCGCQVNYEDELFCDHSGEPIESAYGVEDDCVYSTNHTH